MKSKIAGLFLFAAFIFAASSALPCSSFLLTDGDEAYYGRNFDWHIGYGAAVVNKRNVSKNSIALGDEATSWTSKYGSLTFNHFGRELPMGGMNEAGLVLAVLSENSQKYPMPDDRPSLIIPQWIQYQLDNCATVEEVLATDDKIRLNPFGGLMTHFLVADKSGACASVEFLDGEAAFHTGETMPWKALTNNTYESSLNYLKKHEGFGGDKPASPGARSRDRFVRIARALKEFDPEKSGDPVDYCFGALDDVASRRRTKWSLVYDLKKRRVYFKTDRAPKRRRVDLSVFDFSCLSPVKTLDINADLEGDVSGSFTDYGREKNARRINKVARETSFLAAMPPTLIQALILYPESCVCLE